MKQRLTALLLILTLAMASASASSAQLFHRGYEVENWRGILADSYSVESVSVDDTEQVVTEPVLPVDDTSPSADDNESIATPTADEEPTSELLQPTEPMNEVTPSDLS